MSEIPSPSPTKRNAEEGRIQKEDATASEWDQVGNCSCLDQVKAALPRTAAPVTAERSVSNR